MQLVLLRRRGQGIRMGRIGLRGRRVELLPLRVLRASGRGALPVLLRNWGLGRRGRGWRGRMWRRRSLMRRGIWLSLDRELALH